MSEHDPKVDELRAQLAGSVSEVADLSRKLGLRDAEIADTLQANRVARDLLAQMEARAVAAEARVEALEAALGDCRIQMEAFADQMAGYPNYGRAIERAASALKGPHGG